MKSLRIVIALSIVGTVLPILDAGDYRGNVGKLGAVFSLDWHDDGKVSGTYYYPDRPGVTYRLAGNNFTQGKLYLEEFTGSQLTAKIHLSKVLTDNAVVWKGEMHNTDGRKFAMQFARGRSTSAPATTTAPAPAGTRYTGNVGRLNAVYYLNWHNDGTVSGTYSYPNRPGITYRLTGNNHTEGKLYLEEFTGNSLSARCFLSKRVTSGSVVWEGEMKNTDGRQFPMTMTRDREASAPTINSTVAPEMDDFTRARINLLKKLPAQVTWDQFPKADIADEETYIRDGVYFYQANVLSYTSRPDSFSLSCQLETPKTDWNQPTQFTGPKLTMKIHRHLPIPASEFDSAIIYLQIHESGEVMSVSLHSMGITHYRPSPSGKLEVRGVLITGEMDEMLAHDLTSREVQAAIAKSPSIQFVPDKVAMSSYPDPTLLFRTIRVTKDHGIVIHITAAGPGMLELESLSLDSPSNEVPWTPIGTKNDAAEIPANQRTWEAG